MQYECKSLCKCKNDYNVNRGTYICENIKHLESIANVSVTDYDEIIIAMDTKKKRTNAMAAKMTNSIATNVTSTASINRCSKKVKDSFIYIQFY